MVGELVGVTGRAVRVSWSVRRRWRQSRVVGEYHSTTTRKVKRWDPAIFASPPSMAWKSLNQSHSAHCDEDRSHTEMRTDGTAY